MIKWYDRIGNSIEMKLYDTDEPDSCFEWVKGKVIKGYRYQDGIISMKSDDGRIIWCGCESADFRKTNESLGDFISNADKIRNMSDGELADMLHNVGTYVENGDPMIEIWIGDSKNIFDDSFGHIKEWLQKEED